MLLCALGAISGASLLIINLPQQGGRGTPVLQERKWMPREVKQFLQSHPGCGQKRTQTGPLGIPRPLELLPVVDSKRGQNSVVIKTQESDMPVTGLSAATFLAV